MTETEWLTSKNPKPMLRHLTHEKVRSGSSGPEYVEREVPLVSERKLRLWAVAMYQSASKDWRGRFPEQWLDGKQATRDDDPLFEAMLWCDPLKDLEDDPPMSVRASLLREIAGNPWKPRGVCGKQAEPGLAAAGHCDYYCAVCAEVLSSPLIQGLAKAAYDERIEGGSLHPDRLKVLADALEDIGADEAITSHLRQECEASRGGTDYHYRGCFVIDAILGK